MVHQYIFNLATVLSSLSLVLSYPIFFANAEEIGLGVSESIFDITLLPGGKHTESIGVLNRSRKLALPISVSLSLWDLKENSEDIEFVTAEPALNAAKWFTLSGAEGFTPVGGGQFPASYILSPGEMKDIKFVIASPKNVSPGTYLVTMRFQPVLPPSYFEKGSSKIIPEIAALFFLRVNDLSLDKTAAAFKAELVGLDLISTGEGRASLKNTLIPKVNAGVFEDAIKKIIASISNNGTYHFRTKGFILIKNWYGREVQRVALPERYLLPKRSRTIEIEILPERQRADSFVGDFFLSLKHFISSNSYFGPYTATLVLQSPSLLAEDNVAYVGGIPEGTSLIEQSVLFWVVPWKLWGVLIAIILLISLGFRKFYPRLVAVAAVLRGKSL